MLFALRVLGQALQHWAPLAFLPRFEEFQGSNLPYWVLLTMQLVILTWMVKMTVRVAVGVPTRKARASRILAWVGGLYMLGSLARIAVGLAMADAPAWFTAWISGAFHVVLAGFVLTLAAYYANAPVTPDEARAP